MGSLGHTTVDFLLSTKLIKKKKEKRNEREFIYTEVESHPDTFSDLEEVQLLIRTPYTMFKNVEAAMTR